MSRPSLYPLTFTPVLKDYIWGGRNLETKLGRELPPGKVIAESWEIAAHPHGDVTVANGALAGQSLAALYERYGEALVGRRAAWASRRGRFPLLVKLLDAHRKLSVQVHPDDDFAREHEGNELGKSEMWVVLHAEPGAALILGVQPGATRAQFREAIAAGELEPMAAPSAGAGRRFCLRARRKPACHSRRAAHRRDPAELGHNVSHLRLEPHRRRTASRARCTWTRHWR
jgi:mannose-6-phosphate isomerase class I